MRTVEMLLAVMAIAGEVGCATVSPMPTTTISRNIARTRTVTSQKHGDHVLVSASIAQGDILSARVMAESLCRRTTIDDVSYTQHTSRQTQGVSSDILAGIAGVVGSSIGLIVSSQLSSKSYVDSNGETTSDRDTGLAASAVLGAIGLSFVGHGLFVANQGATHDEFVRSGSEARPSTSPWVPCGAKEPGSADIIVDTGEKRMPLPTRVTGSAFKVQLRTYADVICTDEGLLNTGPGTLRILYVPRSEQEDPFGSSVERAKSDLFLADFNARACTRIYLSGRRTAEAAALLENAETVADFERAATLVQSAYQLAQEVATDEAERTPLLSGIATIRQSLSGRVAGRVSAATATALTTLRANGPVDAEPVITALNLIGISDDGASAWNQIYGVIVQQSVGKGAQGEMTIEALLQKEPSTRNCMRENVCPSWLSSEHVKDVLRSVTKDAASDVERTTGKLRDLCATLTKRTTSRAVMAYDAAVTAASSMNDFCTESEPMRLKPVVDSCSRLREALACEKGLDGERSSHVEAIRASLRRDAETKANKKAAADWRSHFSACRTLGTAARQVQAAEDRGACGADCQTVVVRMQKELERLHSFHGEAISDDDALVSKLRAECQASDCEVCP